MANRRYNGLMITAAMLRRIKFTLLFTGLTVATILVLWVSVRFVFLLWPGAEESAVLAAQPVATEVAVTAVSPPAASPPPLPTVTVPSPSSSAAVPAAEQVTAVSQQLAAPITPPPATNHQPANTDYQSPITGNPLPPQLIIPSLGINRIVKTAPVVAGQWDISQVESDFGWLQTTGANPGDELGITIVGHVTRPWPEIAGPLAELAFMKVGDEIIYRKDGTDYVYALEKFLKVDPQSVESLYVPDGAVLSLATCSSWNYVNFDYDERLIARARLVRSEPSPASLNLTR